MCTERFFIIIFISHCFGSEMPYEEKDPQNGKKNSHTR